MMTESIADLLREHAQRLKFTLTSMLTDFDEDPNATTTLEGIVEYWFNLKDATKLGKPMKPSGLRNLAAANYRAGEPESPRTLEQVEESIIKNLKRLCKIYGLDYAELEREHYKLPWDGESA